MELSNRMPLLNDLYPLFRTTISVYLFPKPMGNPVGQLSGDTFEVSKISDQLFSLPLLYLCCSLRARPADRCFTWLHHYARAACHLRVRGQWFGTDKRLSYLWVDCPNRRDVNNRPSSDVSSFAQRRLRSTFELDLKLLPQGDRFQVRCANVANSATATR